EITLSRGYGGLGGDELNFWSVLGSYQAPRYHIKMMLRPRYMIFESELFNTLSAAASGFDGSERMICIRPSNAGSVFACLKYSLLIWTGSTAGGSLSLAMPAKAAEKAMNNVGSASSAAVVCAAVCVVRFGEPTTPAAVAAAPVSILRRVKPVMTSSWSCSRAGRRSDAAALIVWRSAPFPR